MPSTQRTEQPTIGEVWQQVSARLHAYLRTRGLSRADAEDISQTVAERALRHDVPFGDADELLHWCLTVARNLDVDRRRVLSRRGEAALDLLGDVGQTGTLEDLVVNRLRLVRTTEALAQMRANDREAIVRAVNRTEPASGRERVALYRARARLLEALGAMIALVACGRRALRVLARPAATSPVLAAAVLVTGMAAITDRPSPPRGSRGVVIVPAELTRGVVAKAEPKASLAPVFSRSAAKARTRRMASPERVVVVVPGGVAALSGHDRRPEDAGLVCVRHLPVALPCVGPTAMP